MTSTDNTTDDVADLGPAPERLTLEVADVRRLVDAQFPHWANLPITPVVKGGWDNFTFHLGDDLIVRLPSAAPYALAVGKEVTWLPRLAPHLPLPIPSKAAVGQPDANYPFAWTVQPWLDGSTATRARISDLTRFADDLAGFLMALQAIDPRDGPRPGLHNWFRGGSLRTFDDMATRALEKLGGIIDTDAARALWHAALATPWSGDERWLHGDIAPGNLLVDDDGILCAVIDFGTCGVGDPACDLAIAWTVLDAPARKRFRGRLGVDDHTWMRGLGWSLWKTLTVCASNLSDPENPYDPTDPDEAAAQADFQEAKRILAEILTHVP